MTKRLPLTAHKSRGKQGRLPVNFEEIAQFLWPVLRWFTKLSPFGCWIWEGQCTADGYGEFWHRGERFFVHRVSWQLFEGPIPIDRELMHVCPGGPNRACFNFRHLRLGTHAENERDKRRPAGEIRDEEV